MLNAELLDAKSIRLFKSRRWDVGLNIPCVNWTNLTQNPAPKRLQICMNKLYFWSFIFVRFYFCILGLLDVLDPAYANILILLWWIQSG